MSEDRSDVAVPVHASPAELEAFRMAACEVEWALGAARQYLKDLSHDVQPRGVGDDPSSVMELVGRGIQQVEENEARQLRAFLWRLSDAADKAARRDHPGGGSGHADA